ncbi:MAG: hypothetical protein ABJB86_00575 [Bacteroidota bacterium]
MKIQNKSRLLEKGGKLAACPNIAAVVEQEIFNDQDLTLHLENANTGDNPLASFKIQHLK